jgi:hypothetical protein
MAALFERVVRATDGDTTWAYILEENNAKVANDLHHLFD